MDVCMEILDVLYETEDTSWLFDFPCPLAALTLVTAYVMSVPKQTWEFPILPWGKPLAACLTLLLHRPTNNFLNRLCVLCDFYLE
ncbi:unnamed protein product [Triticum turgidum subsp. durum]|uniref:Uncharacterized protein n=1 Tax=Triticum turgidum subsp. durum TaxID=4567 RepID=A0A9R0TB79_TRITD|nr:unnamed protein product [Triticum turgidum subsp. durum]